MAGHCGKAVPELEGTNLMSSMSIMPRSLNPGIEAASVRAQQSTLGLAAPVAATTAAAPGGGDNAGGAQAVLGAEGVQPKVPSSLKTIFGSVLKGALTGASLAFSLNSITMGTPALSLLVKALNFIPIPQLKAITMVPVLAALVGGAVVGGILGLIGGIKKSKADNAAFQAATAAEAAAQTAAAPPGDPLAVNTDGTPVGSAPPPAAAAAPEPAAVPTPVKAKGAKTNGEMGPDFKSKGKAKARAKKGIKGAHATGGGKYHIVWGDTLGHLARSWGCSVSDIMKANPKIKNANLIYAGDWLVKPDK